MSKFGDAFAAARKAGKSEFTWTDGKKYNTKMAPDASSSSRKSTAASQGDTKPAETKWADPGAKEGGKPREDDAPAKKMDTTGWKDPGAIENKNREAGSGFRKGGMVKKAGAATIGATRSKRDYPKGKK